MIKKDKVQSHKKRMANRKISGIRCMDSSLCRWMILFLFAIIIAVTGCDKKSEVVSPPELKWVAASITTIKEWGKSVDWHHSSNRIATAAPQGGIDGYYDVVIFSMDNPDAITILTHQATGAPQKHNGNPAWHPTGDYLVYTAQNADVPVDEWADFNAKPGRGVNCNLWLAKTDGSGFWQLTFNPTRVDQDAMAIIHPQISHDGNKVFWAERDHWEDDTYWGQWKVKVATLVIDNNPRLQDIQTFDPAEEPAFYETHAFSLDDQSIMFTGNLQAGQHETGMDIYAMDLGTQRLTNMTDTFTDWDEHAHWSPNGELICWMSSTEIVIDWPPSMGYYDWIDYLATELWVMNADGSGVERITFFNDPDHEHNRAERTAVSDSAWGPDGNSLIVLLAHYEGTGPGSKETASSQLVLVTLGQE